MKVLLINGSPRKSGNTHYILKLYGELLQKQMNICPDEIVSISLADQTIQLCRGCRACMEHSESFCPCKDDVSNIEAQMIAADLIIIGSPVYVEDISGLSKTWLDRIVYSDSYEPPARSFRTRLTKDKNQIHENCTAA